MITKNFKKLNYLPKPTGLNSKLNGHIFSLFNSNELILTTRSNLDLYLQKIILPMSNCLKKMWQGFAWREENILIQFLLK